MIGNIDLCLSVLLPYCFLVKQRSKRKLYEDATEGTGRELHLAANSEAVMRIQSEQLAVPG